MSKRRFSAPANGSSPLRFEYRVWGENLSPQRLRLSKGQYCGTSERREIYIVPSDSSEINAKIRGGHLEMKQLLELHLALELWRPCFSRPFPLDRKTVQKMVVPALAMDASTVTASRYGMPDFLNDLIGPATHLTALAVHKVRHDFLLDGVLAEFTEVVGHPFKLKTVAVESDDTHQVLRAANSLEMNGMPNRSYQQALRMLLVGGQAKP